MVVAESVDLRAREPGLGRPRQATVWRSCVAVALVSWLLSLMKGQGHGRIRERHDGSYFPVGCRWRVVDDEVARSRHNVTHAMDRGHRSYVWRQRVYDFDTMSDPDDTPSLDASSSTSIAPPPACTLAGHSVDAREWVRRTPIAATTERHRARNVESTASYRVIENLWYARGSFYKVVDASRPETGSPVALSSNINLHTIAVKDVTAFVENTRSARLVRGETVMLDFSYFVHPTAIGHWLEYLLPVMSARRLEELDGSPPAMVLVMHLKRVFVFEWVRAAFGAAFGRGGATTTMMTLPFPLVFQEETASVWDQKGQRFEGVPDDEWVCFEKVVVAKDVVEDGPRTAFMDEDGERDARGFRERMWAMYGVSGRNGSNEITGETPTTPRRRRITLLHKSANRRIVNRDAFRLMLAEFGDVDEMELTEDVSMASQINAMANTDVLVSTHTSGLANGMFLPPGALVVELRHKFFLSDMERTFELQIKSLKDVDWIGWRSSEVTYLHENDERKFKGWGDLGCDDVNECVEAGTLVDVHVDVDAVRRLIQDRLQG